MSSPELPLHCRDATRPAEHKRMPITRQSVVSCITFIVGCPCGGPSSGNRGRKIFRGTSLGQSSLSVHYHLNRSSRLISMSGVGAALLPVVVKPTHRPRKITVIHRAIESTAASFPKGGADLSLSQRRTLRPLVSSKTTILRPDNAISRIFQRN